MVVDGMTTLLWLKSHQMNHLTITGSNEYGKSLFGTPFFCVFSKRLFRSHELPAAIEISSWRNPIHWSRESSNILPSSIISSPWRGAWEQDTWCGHSCQDQKWDHLSWPNPCWRKKRPLQQTHQSTVAKYNELLYCRQDGLWWTSTQWV